MQVLNGEVGPSITISTYRNLTVRQDGCGLRQHVSQVQEDEEGVWHEVHKQKSNHVVLLEQRVKQRSHQKLFGC